MRYFFIILIFIVPVIIIAKDQNEQKDFFKEFDNSKKPTLITHPKKPITPPVILSDNDKAQLNKLEKFQKSLSHEVNKELKNYFIEIKKLSELKKQLYNNLSKDAKKALAFKAEINNKLSNKGKKIAKNSFMNNNLF